MGLCVFFSVDLEGATAYCTTRGIIDFVQQVAANARDNDFIRPFIVNDPALLFYNVPESFENLKSKPGYEERGQKELSKESGKQYQAEQVVMPPESLHSITH